MYASLVAHSGAKPVPLPLTEETGFRFSPDQFRERLSDRTRAIIINTPHNPTGGVLEVEDLEIIAEEARRRDLVVLSDEIYINFLYDGTFKSIASLPNMKERTVIASTGVCFLTYMRIFTKPWRDRLLSLPVRGSLLPSSNQPSRPACRFTTDGMSTW